MSDNGKGDIQRPFDREKFGRNYDQMDWNDWPSAEELKRRKKEQEQRSTQTVRR